jgi:2,4-dienoyl-CoA reductase-like NADH-dependent reductase (Old Yellow Enzyme family)
MKPLLQPLQIGALKLKNRIVMAPLTRTRATGSDERTPNELMKEYYVQRASAGLIISEATSVMPMGVGYPNTPGIWSEEQVTHWKEITDGVHKVGGLIILQLWHVGRISDPIYLNGELPVSASAVRPAGHVSLIRPQKEFVTPRALDLTEIKVVVEAYRKAALNAKRAGFDGVEVHGANGYLPDQFLQDASNKRTDEYGGSIANRARFMFEVLDAAIAVWGADRVGLHLSPRSDVASMGDSERKKTFEYVAQQVANRKIAFICAREYFGPDSLGPKLKRIFGGAYIGNEKFTFASAEQALSRGDIDAVAFGKDFISNPDLVERYAKGAPLNPPKPETFYTRGNIGYTDYPFLINNN